MRNLPQTLASGEGYFDLRYHERAFRLGYAGIGFTEPGDKVFYLLRNDEPNNSIMADATLLASKDVSKAIDPEQNKEVRSKSRLKEGVLIKLNTPYQGRREYPTGTVLLYC